MTDAPAPPHPDDVPLEHADVSNAIFDRMMAAEDPEEMARLARAVSVGLAVHDPVRDEPAPTIDELPTNTGGAVAVEERPTASREAVERLEAVMGRLIASGVSRGDIVGALDRDEDLFVIAPQRVDGEDYIALIVNDECHYLGRSEWVGLVTFLNRCIAKVPPPPAA